ncbi:MAG: tyrosine-type recombinase/integrase [Patescibacteria group bacterium]
MLKHIDDYLLYLQTNNYSEETIYNYERDLLIFENYLKDNKIIFEHLNKKDIEMFKAYLSSRDRKTPGALSPTEYKLLARSINRILSVIRSYIRYLIDMDCKYPLAPEAIKLVKTVKKHAQVAELDDLVKLIESPTELEKNKIIGLRNRAMLELLFSTGMRISELVNLKMIQIDNSGKIFILGKGKKERFVYMTPRAFKYLNNYLKIRQNNSKYLFIPYRGLNSSVVDKKISPNYLQMKIKQYREILHINVPTSAHSLRHGFATYLAESGANPAAIQILLGHESLDTTTRYVHASDRYAEKTHHKFHPLKND